MGKRKKSRRKSKALVPPLPSWVPVSVVVIVFLVQGYRFFSLISNYAVNLFYWDQWDFDEANLFETHSVWQMFTWQHGPHRQGVGAVLAWLVEPFFRWNSRTESFLVGGIIAGAALLALLLKHRLYGQMS